MEKPYYELRTFDFIYRKFIQEIDEQELVWHRDERDREVIILGPTDWKLQLENELPKQLRDSVTIPKDTYHRLIKGTGDLDIKILEL